MDNPMTLRGKSQGVYQISATPKAEVGDVFIDRKGRKYHYAQAGASDLAAGKLVMAPTCNASLVNQAITAAVAVGTQSLTLTVTAPGAAIAADYFAGGLLQINDANGEGHQYLIESSTAVAATGTSIIVALHEGIRLALTTSSEFSLIPSPWRAVAKSATEENLPVGVPPVPVTAGYYFWCQTYGPACVLSGDSAAIGSRLLPGSTAGAVVEASSTWDTDQPEVGVAYGTVGVATEYKPVFLKL